MTVVHIYTAPWQPLTRYVVNFGDHEHAFVSKPRSLWRCHACRRRRRAENLEVQVFYDTTRVRCLGGGCRAARRRR